MTPALRHDLPRRVKTQPWAPLAQAMLEAELQRNVIDMAHTHRCLVVHFRPARTKDGEWRTPVQGDDGFPDLVIAGRRGTLVRELKSMRGQTTPGRRAKQNAWIARLIMGGTDAAMWDPADWFTGRIEAEIKAIA